MAGHQIFGKYDGVAPGAQILDYDLSELSFVPDENAYTIGKFLKGISTLAENGAEVINMSYSFYFHSAESQKAMSQALNALIDHYKVLLVFSAGNNGPGLGSMNRSLIYPRNSLVAGAYISKEMDSLVHGATGIDEQGQIVYYSSRGPGGDYGMGPSVISPLASITHGDAESPARSFSGTSSAAPALAGFSAVLMSAIKQEGLKIDISSVVAAVKYSGKMLENTPFVFQGFGLPQIEKALELYKKIQLGKLPREAVIGSTQLPRRDGVTSMGRLIRLEDAPSFEEMRLSVFGRFNLLRNSHEDEQDILIADVEYSHRWLSGPKKIWYSNRGGAQFSLTANYDQIKNNKTGEYFGEVRVVDPKTKAVMSVMPITVISEPVLRNVLKKEITLSPEAAHRTFFRTTNDTNGVDLTLDTSELLGGRVTFRLYNSDGVRIESGSIRGGDELKFGYSLIPGEAYQIALSRYRGNQDISFSMKLKPIRLQSKTSVTNEKGGIVVVNKSNTTIKGHLGIRSIIPAVESGFVSPTKNKSYKFSYKIKEKGSYQIKLVSPSNPDLSYFSYRCFQTKERLINDQLIEPVTGVLLVEEDGDLDQVVNVECFIFDLAPGVMMNKPFEYRVFNEATREERWSKVVKVSAKSSISLTSKSLDLVRGHHQILFETLSGARVNLGELKIYPSVEEVESN